MANTAGRDGIVVQKNSTTIASVRTKSFRYAGTPIDTTNDDSAGVVEYLADKFSSETMEWTVEGLEDDGVLEALATSVTPADRHLSDLTFTMPSGDVISGNFVMTAFDVTGTYQEATTFTATFVRNGIHTLTPAV